MRRVKEPWSRSRGTGQGGACDQPQMLTPVLQLVTWALFLRRGREVVPGGSDKGQVWGWSAGQFPGMWWGPGSEE